MPAPGALDRRTLRILIFLLLALAAFSIHRYWFAAPPGPYLTFAGQTMGTTWEVKVASESFSPNEQRRTAAAAQAALDHVDGLMSTWNPDSEVSRLNAWSERGSFRLSRETSDVLAVANEISELTEGAFDVTVRPLVNAWGFGAVDGPAAAPSAEALAALRERVGWRKLSVDPRAPSIRKAHPGTEVDLSAIAKGFGVDQVAEALLALGHRDFLVEVGGELRASGVRLDGAPWRVAIEQPDSPIREIHEVIELRDLSMATSGDYRNYYEEAGVRISHTIDPREGRPIRHRLASVTVLHAKAVYADAWATALNVLGPEAGYALAEREGLAVYFIQRAESPEAGTPRQFTTRATRRFAALLEQTEAH